MLDKLKNLKKHLKQQIKVSEQLDSDWVYILRKEAKTCLELAEAEDTIIEMLNDKEGKIQ